MPPSKEPLAMKGHEALDLVHLPGSVAVPSNTEAGLEEEHGFGAA